MFAQHLIIWSTKAYYCFFTRGWKAQVLLMAIYESISWIWYLISLWPLDGDPSKTLTQICQCKEMQLAGLCHLVSHSNPIIVWQRHELSAKAMSNGERRTNLPYSPKMQFRIVSAQTDTRKDLFLPSARKHFIHSLFRLSVCQILNRIICK
jgi:hypothetical protein